MFRRMCLTMALAAAAAVAGRIDQTLVFGAKPGEARFRVRAAAQASSLTTQAPSPGSARLDVTGRIDTVGGTIYDLQYTGPQRQSIYYDPRYGIHVCWIHSAVLGNGYPDLNVRYNFWDGRTTLDWLYKGGDFIDWGVQGWSTRTGFGMMDVNPLTGCAYLSAQAVNASSQTYSTFVHDAGPGLARWQESVGDTGYYSPAIAIGDSGKLHVGMIGTNGQVYYARFDSWGRWTRPVAVGSPGLGNASHNIAASKLGSRVAITWVWEDDTAPSAPRRCYYRRSTNGGASWTDTIPLLPPPAFHPGSETLVSFAASGVYPFLDARESLHIVAAVSPFVNNAVLTLPAGIWHWSQAFGWSLVHEYPYPHAPSHPSAPAGRQAIFATRPSIAQGVGDEFVCVWEQFDTANFEATTNRARADIFGARSTDGGVVWGPAVRITTPDSTSKRYPSIAPALMSDTCLIHYEVDLLAGFALYDEGEATLNPQIVQHVWKEEFRSGIEERASGLPTRLALEAPYPNPCRGSVLIRYSVPWAGPVRLAICDATGRVIRTLVNGRAGPGKCAARWDGVTGDGREAVPGVYFCTLNATGARLSEKLALLRY